MKVGTGTGLWYGGYRNSATMETVTVRGILASAYHLSYLSCPWYWKAKTTMLPGPDDCMHVQRDTRPRNGQKANRDLLSAERTLRMSFPDEQLGKIETRGGLECPTCMNSCYCLSFYSNHPSLSLRESLGMRYLACPANVVLHVIPNYC